MAIITLTGINEAIDNLNLKEATLKGKLLHAIRTQFPDEGSLDTVKTIDPLYLINKLWAPQTSDEIKAKRKSLSSLKSSINKNLKQGIKSGANPEGIIIGRDNIFIISDETKNLLLDKLTLPGDGGNSLLSTIAALNDMLAGVAPPTDKNEALKILDQLDAARKNLMKLAGLSAEGSGEGESPATGEVGNHAQVEEFEVDEDTVIEFIEEDTLSETKEDGEFPQAGDSTGDGDDGTGFAESRNLDKDVEGKEYPDIPGDDDDSGLGTGFDDEGPHQTETGNLLAGEDLAGGAIAEEDDWESFEVVEDDFDILDTEDGSGQNPEPPEEDVEFIDEVDDVLEEKTDLTEDLEQVEEIEVEAEDDIEEVAEEDIVELSTIPEFVDDAGLEKVAAEGGEQQAGDTPEDDWDSFEVIDDDYDMLDAEDENERGTEPGEEEVEIIDGVDEEDILENASDIITEEGRGDNLNQESGTSDPPQHRSMNLSQYIEAEEAFINITDVLQENNEEYVRQILEHFMPKFIKIPEGIYPVGGKKKRTADRAASQLSLPGFYIGQLPITNDLFDFFVRETGYETEAELQGHGLVTSGRLRADLKQKTGRHTLAINKGAITRQIQGANWRHPDGPDCSLENRGHHPVVQISRLDAMAFATWAGKRLPSEDEWESAARGKEGFLFPWGNEFLPLANLEGQQAGSTTPVTYFGRQSLSPFGLLDMLGNVFEWTSSNYNSQNDRELSILKGGSWATTHITCADRLIEPTTTWSNTIGFRCAVDAD